MMNLAQEYVDKKDNDPRLAAMFGGDKNPIENFLGVCAASLFAFFCYLKGTRDKLSLSSTHPHPLVRSIYLRDLIVRAARDRWGLDTKTFGQAYETRLYEFMDVMENISLFDSDIFSENYASTLNELVEALPALQDRYRPSCAQWSWMSWG